MHLVQRHIEDALQRRGARLGNLPPPAAGPGAGRELVNGGWSDIVFLCRSDVGSGGADHHARGQPTHAAAAVLARARPRRRDCATQLGVLSGARTGESTRAGGEGAEAGLVGGPPLRTLAAFLALAAPPGAAFFAFEALLA